MQDYEPGPSYTHMRDHRFWRINRPYRIMQHIPDVGENGIDIEIGKVPYKPHIIREGSNGSVIVDILVKEQNNGGCCVPTKVLEKLMGEESNFSTMAVESRGNGHVNIALEFKNA